jgi:hypothetical protein
MFSHACGDVLTHTRRQNLGPRNGATNAIAIESSLRESEIPSSRGNRCAVARAPGFRCGRGERRVTLPPPSLTL